MMLKAVSQTMVTYLTFLILRDVCQGGPLSINLFVICIELLSFNILTTTEDIYRDSYISVHILLNLLNKLGKRDKMRAFFAWRYFTPRRDVIR